MSTRSVIVRLEAQVANYEAGMKKAAAATGATAKAQDELGKSADKASQTATDAAKRQAEAAKEVGQAMAGFGTATVAALGLTAKAAMDWESAWTGVTKTVDGSPEQMAALEGSLRGLAKTLPIAHEEIAGVAEAAGQLGVARQDIVGFTKTMIDLGESTNLTADEAATNIAQISNVMGTMAREGSEGVSRFGSTLVALGNDGASTEKEILAMAQRIAGAGATIGASESDVLALSNTLASMGVKAEMGGGVTTRVLLKMYAAVKDGGDGLEAFAKVAGTSSAEFAKAFGDSPIKAMDLVNKGLARVKAEGGNVVSTMKDLGIKGTEETQVMLALAASGDLLSDSLKLGSEAWKENTALLEEANKRYATAESKVKVAWNNIADAAIDAGAVLLPAIAGMADGVVDLANVFGDLPQPVQAALTIIAGVVGVSAVAGGAFLTLLPKIQAINASLIAMGPAGKAASVGLTTVAKGAGIGLAALGAFMVASEAAGSGMDKIGDSSKFGQAMIQMSKDSKLGSDAVDQLMTVAGSSLTDINGLADSLKTVNMNGFLKGLDWVGSVGGIFDSELGLAGKAIKNFDTSLSQLASGGNFDLAAEGFKRAVDAGKEQGLTIDQVAKSFPDYLDALKSAAIEQGGFAAGADLLKLAIGEVPLKIKESGEAAAIAAEQQKEGAAMASDLAKALEDVGVGASGSIDDIQKFAETLFGTGLAIMSSRDATFKWKDTLRDMGAEIEKINATQETLGAVLNATGTDFNTTTDAGMNANEMFQGIIKQGLDVAKTFSGDVTKSNEDVQAQLTATYDAAKLAADGFGLGVDEADSLIRTLLHIPPKVDIKTWMSDEAKRMAGGTKAAIEAIPGQKDIWVTTHLHSIYSENRLSTGQGGAGGQTKAAGGAIYGPGTGTSDDVPIMASNGEHMLTAAEVQMMGGQNAVYRFRASLRNGNGNGIASHAGGGAIGSAVASRSLVASSGQSIDYARLAGAVAGTGTTYQFTVPDKATAADYFAEARYQTRVNSRGGARR